MIETIKVDLHCHSSLSDGDHSPAYVAHSIAATGAEWAALTDHNSVSGQHQFRTVLERRGIRSLVGLEMDARSPNGVIHLLGYGFDPEYQPLLEALYLLRQPFRASARYWMDRVGGLAFKRFLAIDDDVPAYDRLEPPRPPSTSEVIDLLHSAGGLVFLAHPLGGIGTLKRLEEMLEWLQPEGLDGLEAFHKPYPPDTQEALLQIALRRQLLTVAGSDFHGVHHSDGTDPGVDMPLIHWKQFMAALTYHAADVPPSPYANRFAT